MTVKEALPDKNPTIYKIAELAGVSHTCVSRALLDRDDIGEDTKKRIRKLAADLDYYPNESARSLVLKKTATVGVSIGAFNATNNQEFLQYLFNELKKNGYSMLLFINDYTVPENEIKLLQRKKIDGLILSSGVSEKSIKYIDKYKKDSAYYRMPVVSYDDFVYVKNSVTIDRSEGTFNAVKYLIGLGHKDFAYLCHQEMIASMSTLSKVKGFRQALLENGLVCRDEWMLEDMGSYETGYENTRKLLRQKRMPTAIFYNGDIPAIGGLAALAEHGVRVPEDVSVVGFDNMPVSGYTVPPLTTIEKPLEKMAKLVVKLLMKKIKNPGIINEQIKLKQNFIVRKSTGPAKTLK